MEEITSPAKAVTLLDETPHKTELVICIPCMQTLDYHFVTSLINLTKPADTTYIFEANSLVPEARNSLSKQAIEMDSEYVLWLDSDMSIPKNAYEVLKSRDLDIVGGLYFKRVPPYSPLIYQGTQLSTDFREVIDYGKQLFEYPRQSVFEVDGCGFGCLLMKTKVLKDVLDHYGMLFDMTAPGVGEDLTFLLKAKSLGYKVYCDSTVLPGHVGALIANEDLYRQYNHII